MTIEAVLSKIEFNMHATADQIAVIRGIITQAYNSSQTARAMFDGFAANPEAYVLFHPQQNSFRATYDQAGWETPSQIYYDFTMLANLHFLDENGTPQLVSFQRAIIHELIHAIVKTEDIVPEPTNWTTPGTDYVGDTVPIENVIMFEMGEHYERATYKSALYASDLQTLGISAGSNLTKGHSVGNVLVDNVGYDKIDTSDRSDVQLLIGLSGSDTIKSGAGNDFLYGGNGSDALGGGLGADYIYGNEGTDALVGGVISLNFDSNAVDLSNYQSDFDDGRVDYLHGGAGIDTYFLASAQEVDLTWKDDISGQTIIDVEGIRNAMAYVDYIVGDSDYTIKGQGLGQFGTRVSHFTITNDLVTNASAHSNGGMSIAGASGTGANSLRGVYYHNFDHPELGPVKMLMVDVSDWAAVVGGISIATPRDYGATGGGPWWIFGNDGGAAGFNLNQAANSNGPNDILVAGNTEDYVYAYGGDDKIIAGQYAGGVDYLDGGAGVDTVDYSSTSSNLSATLAASGLGSVTGLGATSNDQLINIENIVTGSGNDIVTGSSDDNTISLGSGSDTTNAGAGDDLIDGGAGDDTLNGGAGFRDTLLLFGQFASYSFSYNADGSVTVQSAAGGNDTLTNIEFVRFQDASGSFTEYDIDEFRPSNLVATAGNDILVGTVGAETIAGLAGDDQISGRSGNDRLEGGDGNDQLDGGQGVDTLVGGNGNDTYFVDNVGDTIIEVANGGTDELISSISWTLAAGSNIEVFNLTGNLSINATGNAESNTIVGNGSSNILWGLDANDHLTSKDGNDTLYGGNGDDYLWGQRGDDILYGDADNDDLNGGDGNDTIYGGTGDDELHGDAGVDRLVGGVGNDTYSIDDEDEVIVEYSAEGADLVKAYASFELGDFVENLTLMGSAVLGNGNDLANVIVGTAGRNVIGGRGGNDVIKGGGGKDTIWGDAGNDTITGGAGADEFIYSSGSGVDVITDFEFGAGNDVIDLNRIYTINGFSDLKQNHLDVAGNGDIFIFWGDNRIRLPGLDNPGQLAANDFSFT